MLAQSRNRGSGVGVPGHSTWTTPRQLQALLVATGLSAAIFLIVSYLALQTSLDRVRLVSQEAVPGRLAASRAITALFDLDRVVAASFLQERVGGELRDEYRERRSALNRQLVHASEHIVFEEAQRRPMVRLLDSLSLYERQLVAVWLSLENGERRRAVQKYEEASETLLSGTLPAAEAYRQATVAEQQRREEATRLSAIIYLPLSLLSGLLLLAVLARTQIFLVHRTRRRINPHCSARPCW